MKSYESQKVKSSILKEQHEKMSEKQELFLFLVCRGAAYQKSKEIFEGDEVEVGRAVFVPGEVVELFSLKISPKANIFLELTSVKLTRTVRNSYCKLAGTAAVNSIIST